MGSYRNGDTGVPNSDHLAMGRYRSPAGGWMMLGWFPLEGTSFFRERLISSERKCCCLDVVVG